MAHINIMQDGVIKAIDFTPWGGLEGFLSATSGSNTMGNATRLRQLVPWLNKAVTMTANSVAQLPYYFDDGSENEIDPDKIWGGVKNPQTLLYLIASSLCGGCAYVLVEATNRALVNLQYVAPHTMKPNYNSNMELISFTRQLDQASRIYALEEVVYFWLPDDTVEIGPAQIHPLRNAMLPAGMIAAMDYTMEQYGERGFIPHTILSAKGLPNKAEAEKVEKWWNLWLRMKDKTAAKIINADSMSTSVVGAGMDELRGSYIEIMRQQIENIASAFNIPLSRFLSNAANYATANADNKQWYSDGVFVNIYQTIEDSFSDQLFSRFGYDMEFDPEGIDAFQEDENAKASSLSTLSSAFAANPEASLIAADVLGYELDEEQIAAIEALKPEEEPEPTPAPVPEQFITQPAPEMDMPSDEENAIADEMMAWRKFTERPRKREFETKHIPPALALRINAGLRAAKSQDEIQAVFDGVANELPVIRLAKAIEGMNE